MRWRLLRRRLSVSAPRMIVRSHLPWPLRWALLALMCGFSAALALWAFEFGKDIAGLDRGAKVELQKLRVELAQLRSEREGAVSIANTAQSLLTTERAVQATLAQQLKVIEFENLALRGDLGFFERLLPAGANEGLVIRGLRVEPQGAGRVRYQMLVMQPGKFRPEFSGRYEVTLAGTLDGKPWSLSQPGGPQALNVKQYVRIEGVIEHALSAMVKSATVKVSDLRGGLKVTLMVKL